MSEVRLTLRVLRVLSRTPTRRSTPCNFPSAEARVVATRVSRSRARASPLPSMIWMRMIPKRALVMSSPPRPRARRLLSPIRVAVSPSRARISPWVVDEDRRNRGDAGYREGMQCQKMAFPGSKISSTDSRLALEYFLMLFWRNSSVWQTTVSMSTCTSRDLSADLPSIPSRSCNLFYLITR